MNGIMVNNTKLHTHNIHRCTDTNILNLLPFCNKKQENTISNIINEPGDKYTIKVRKAYTHRKIMWLQLHVEHENAQPTQGKTRKVVIVDWASGRHLKTAINLIIWWECKTHHGRRQMG